MKYRKKPVEIEAFRLGYEHFPEWLINAHNAGKIILIFNEDCPIKASIETLEGKMIARSGDYIIRGVQGEIYPCKADIFDLTYEKVESEKENGTSENNG